MKKVSSLTLGALVTGVLFSGVGSADASVNKHIVKEGETLTTIAKSHKTTVSELQKENKLSNANTIKVGQVINYNDGKDSVRTVYTVKKGDTLYKIGKKFNVNYLDIMKKNNLTTTLIYEGDKLVVKGTPFEQQNKLNVQQTQVPVQQVPVQQVPVKQTQVQQVPVQQVQTQVQQAPVQRVQTQVQKVQAPVQKAPVQQSQVQAPVKQSQASTPSSQTNSSVDEHLKVIMQRESGGNPRAVNPNGHYGLFQFSPQTWAAVGGTGNPADASVDEQWKRARILYTQHGAQHWTTAY